MAAVDSFSLLYRQMARSCSSTVETLALVGALYTACRVCTVLHRCCSLVRVHFLPRLMPNRRTLAQRFGAWAVIHGAADDTAHAYAEELARQGMSLLFVSRDGTMSTDLSKALSQRHGVEVTVVEADLALGDAAIQSLREALGDKDVGILVNCGARSLEEPIPLTETSEQGLLELVNRAVLAAALMTRLVLPGMVEQGRGALVHLCSGAGSRSSGAALFASQVRSRVGEASSVLDLGGWLVPEAEVYARHAISTLGVAHHTTGYWPHTLQHGVMSYIPERIWSLASQFL
ncbi:inactive hydroxysteroid dehydrogenase-like protein 1 isoform X2 [Gadus macrocephalus]|uniref:inactive hydroxysteroid dehydrogenase-like protein 1 isoform X2 n=1 Tax=Gadus macrocephalus TaxID=80720 RepID=UPI0028CBB674|nr:inactive hydroxysteroid dehydrogenase-like protein 1 isoform X2 [Gadus macrocephalus]